MKLEQIHQLIQQGQFERALQACFENIEAHPEEVENYINSGILLAEAGEVDKAERFFQRAITLQPENGIIYYNLANVYFNEGRYQEAVRLYQNAISHHIGQKDVYYMLGLALLQLDAQKQALPYMMRAAELDPDFEDLEVQFQFALLMCELEMYDQAIPILNQILEKDAQHVDAQYNLTLALYMCNENIDAAIQGFVRAVSIDSQHMLSQHALKTFRHMKNEEEV
ncbi:tetratricopeptide repeat protein [Staphylococcus lutrae]|uniref:Tetratricopeptide repeat protein n=1 Tax=Staphylococcus lutrae TaxID=155085 RepID=A0AAC9RSC0_9STAP|nr:tetratricopeptide repeat protein [Staphylococcus lutrae]ARJ49925.1 hypothetical protein B5P37_00435 [Staphylococcus lutrae]PNZ38600.1 tetratricopeptide repeat protein [Staphylococcus lutrae]